MIVRKLPDTFDQLVFEAGAPRNPGCHVSDIVQSMLREMDAKKYAEDRFPPDQKQLFLHSGFAFEKLVEQAFQSRRADIIRPGEFEMDGVYLTPDGLDLDTGYNDEIKLTWKSLNGAPHGPKFWGWIAQFKAYCRVLGTNKCVVRGLFVNGDYRHGYLPDYGVWEIEFTRGEIEQNWRLLLDHAKRKGML